MNGEEERRRKIILNAEVAAIAGQGILAVMGTALTDEQVGELIRCDIDYLERVRAIAPHLWAREGGIHPGLAG